MPGRERTTLSYGRVGGSIMIVDLSNVRIFVRPGYTDMRKAVNGLTMIIQEVMGHDPFSGSVYIFCNRERKLIKAVYWEKSGFWLSQKRLEKDKYPWPQTGEEAQELNGEELAMLLRGIDFFKAHKQIFYKNVS
jgi:transposase